MKAEITDFGSQRRILLKLAVSSLVAAACSQTPTATPPSETLIRIDPGQTKKTPEFTINNGVRNSVVINPSRFRFAVRECFTDQPQLLPQIKPDVITFDLKPGRVFKEFEPPLKPIRMEGKTQVFLATDSYVALFESERSLDPLGTQSSEMLSHLFVAGVFCWARRRDVCTDHDWSEIQRNFFNTSALLKSSMNFAGFVNLGPTA